MKIGKRSLLLLLLLLLLTGCGTKKVEEKKTIKIGVTLYDQYDAYIAALTNKFKEYATAKSTETGKTINVEIMNAAGSQSTQNKQVKSMINSGYDVICVNLVDRTDPSVIIDTAKENDIPIIFFNRELVEEDLERFEKLYYVGARAFESGIMEGELVVEYFAKHPEMDRNEDGLLQYMVLEGEAGHQDAIVRTEYSTSTIEGHEIGLEKLDYSIANWSRDQAKTKVLQILSQEEFPELIISNNDYMALGAIDAYETNYIEKRLWPVIFGIDGIKEGLEAVKQGKMAATVYNDKEGQAKAMLDLAYLIAMDQDLSECNLEHGKYIRLPYTKITPENVEEFMD
ncbi:MAG: galactose ABC transporter substrate-binding protein [Lachnospiraceae bacterium]|nr:galactose ABC transporter substrate-binding protein [Lachnospiraceae bacterium]